MGRALLADRLAWQHATRGNDREADYALGVAEEAIHEHGDEPGPDWAYWADPDEIAIMTGHCWAELHRPLRAVPASEDALARYDDTRAPDEALAKRLEPQRSLAPVGALLERAKG